MTLSSAGCQHVDTIMFLFGVEMMWRVGADCLGCAAFFKLDSMVLPLKDVAPTGSLLPQKNFYPTEPSPLGGLALTWSFLP